MSTPSSNSRDVYPPTAGGPVEVRPAPGLGWFTLCVLLIAVLTLWLLTYPFDFQARMVTSWLGEWGLANIHRINLASNLVLFMPLGCAWVWRRQLARGNPGIGTVLGAGAICAVVSVIGETMQTHLPDRTSSAIDLLANVLGGCAGAVVGAFSASHFYRCWTRAARWLGPRAGMRRCLIALTFLLAVRTAPFDVSLETYYLRVKWEQETKLSVMPFNATRQWLNASGGSDGATVTQRRDRALNELGSAISTALFFLMMAWSLGRAGSDVGATGCSWSVLALAACVALVLVTEVAQFFVRSRLMDITDPLAGGVAIGLGLLVEWVTRPRAGPTP